jgi:molybdenum cofactor biosynthesis enzyme MoaA
VVVPLTEILERMSSFAPFHEIAHEPSSTSRRYCFDDGSGEFGVIAPVTLPFCGACSRIRLTSDGNSYLFVLTARTRSARRSAERWRRRRAHTCD